MPSTYQSSGKGQYPKHPNIVDDFGENPARFLSMSNPDTSLALIQGIEDLARARAWRAVELRDFGGRKVILDAIDERIDDLEGGDE